MGGKKIKIQGLISIYEFYKRTCVFLGKKFQKSLPMSAKRERSPRGDDPNASSHSEKKYPTEVLMLKDNVNIFIYCNAFTPSLVYHPKI